MNDKREYDIVQVMKLIDDNKLVKSYLKGCPYDLLKYWQVRHFKKGEAILTQGQRCNEFSIIISGFAEITNVSEDGKTYCLAIYRKGDILGELEIFDKLDYCCNAVAMSDLTLIEIKADKFYELVNRDNQFILNLTKNICRSFYNLSLKASEDTMKPIKYRICSLLVGFVRDKMYVEKTGKVLVKKSKISDIMAVSTRSIDRAIKDLKEDGAISIKDGYIYILDMEKLKREISG